MAEVTGPISTLPGASHHVPEGTMCDYHPDRPAVARIQGETDSFGCEMEDLCEECREADRKAEREADTSGKCDWCKQDKPRLRFKRDYEEGMHGPVYRVCDECSDRQDEEDRQYLDSHMDWFDCI